MIRKESNLAPATLNNCFHGWLLLAGLMLLGCWLLWITDLWRLLLENDATYIALIILIVFFFSSLFLGYSAWQLSRQVNYAQQLEAPPSSWLHDHLRLRQQALCADDTLSSDALQARLIEVIHGRHSNGWLAADIMLRLGLIGTVIGFIVMLGSVSDLQDDGIHVLKALLTDLSQGMQIALYTTLTGLSASVLTSLQCHWLDRCADRLMSYIIAVSIATEANR